MLPRLLFVGLILLYFAGTLEGKLHYAVIVPSEIQALSSQLACLHVNGAEGETSIKLTLRTVKGNRTLIEKNIDQKSLFSCIPFQIPNPSEGMEEVATMDLSIETSLETISNQTKVLIKKQRSKILVQTDKPVYKPGQNVKFRVVALKENLQPAGRKIPVVELQNPEKNRIGQWLNVTLNKGMADFSFSLSPEPILGDYTIRIKDTAHIFSVEEYVLPKFETSMEFPPVVMFNSEHVPVKICGRYTYGKPVRGVFNGSVCRRSFSYWWRRNQDSSLLLCHNITGKLDNDGCALTKVDSDHFDLTKSGFQMSLEGTASVTEDGTGIELSTSTSTSISNVFEKVSFVDADPSYKPGIPYSGMLKVTDVTGLPIPDKEIYLTCTCRSNKEKLTLVTDSNGHATFKMNDTDLWEGRISITAKANLEEAPYKSGIIKPQHGHAFLSLQPFYSASKSFLKLHSQANVLPCEGQQEVQVDYIINHTELDAETKSLNVHYLIASKSSIWDSGTIDILVESDSKELTGTTSFNLPLSPDVSPNLIAIVYILLPDGEIVADSAKFTVQRCFKNKVSVGFSPDEVLPGSDVSLQIQAEAGSLCGLRVVDQSVVLMKPERELTADKVHSLFPVNDFGGYDHRVGERETSCGRSYSHRYFSRSRTNYIDVYSLFKDMRLKIITSANIKKPVECHRFGIAYSRTMARKPVLNRVIGEMDDVDNFVLMSAPYNIPDEPKKMEKVRQYFPETWLWQLSLLGDSGSAELLETAPDTITDWHAGAFCLGPNGFGISSAATLRTFQPFFVELTLPYSVVREESFTLKATVFNYLKECIKVKVTLKESEELDEEPCTDCQHTSCLCADESKTFHWNLKATKLGEVNITVRTEALDTQELCDNEQPVVPKQGSIDTVIKPLLVQPGGVLEENSHSSLLCIQTGEDHSKSEEISLKLPQNVIKDSARAYVTVLGDLMGTAMQNLDRLLAMPYGCGEQNMVLFAPNIFILQYLEKTHQLNDEIQNKAKTFLKNGYQRQLTYKRDDGSYSAFGKNDPEGNTWLSAFVVKSFNKARPYIFIDESHLNHSFTWLRDHRKDTGCFRSVGKLFNNAMKGGVEDDVSLSAYVTIALLESGISTEDPLVGDSLSCLRKAAVNVSNVYTQALLAYTFTLAGDTDFRQQLMEKLDKQAVRKDGQLHWERQTTTPASDVSFWYRAPSAEVELTSYMLLTMLCGPEQDLGRASEIVNWLSKQQNPYGGFSSTQDTIVALQALAKYAEATFSDTGDVTVTVQSQTGVVDFHVDNTNRLLLQKMTLPDVPGEYTLTATGTGCVYVQTVLRYNVPPPRSDATFAVSVEVKPGQCSEESVTKLQIHITAEYKGSRERSNMALIEVKMLSGFIPMKKSVRELEKSKVIQRSDIQTDMVTLYLNELGHTPLKLSFMVEQDIEVKNLKPATVKIYDYYETGEYAIAEYNSPCSSVEKTNN
ncbi:alpha-2-macroglobulin-like isoform X2 [Pelobates fuscus]|uniref:alpha-2-macroglobulin-like isoform X2 n=1 Tax=Pelobates fuscus TaxID=191477 RepID=UPI002FE46FA9